MGNQDLSDTIKRQQERIEDIEKEVRSMNLVIQEIKEEGQENKAIILVKIKEIVKKMEVQEARKIEYMEHLKYNKLVILEEVYALKDLEKNKTVNENQERAKMKAKMDSTKGRTIIQRSPKGEEEKGVKYSRLEGDQEQQPTKLKNC
ncbi:hypothetical protein FQA39_LY13122 [Lamprigera yunnana]|nr:hypothetical protein FQA39_LY13122 [Lamprigera yunnana]